MGMTDNNLCKSCINLGCEFQSGIVRTKCAFYMPPHKDAPTVDAIPKSDYENRLKADMVAMLTELQLEIEELTSNYEVPNIYVKIGMREIENEIQDLIQKKINSLKENKK